MGGYSTPTPRSDSSLRVWLAYIVRGKLDILLSHLQEKKTPLTMERVHKMRVSARRLEAVLRIFQDAFPRKKVRSLREDLREFIRLLGAVREYDVFLAMLGKRSSKLRGEEKIVVELFLARQFRRQNKALERFTLRLETFGRGELQRSCLALVKTLRETGGQATPDGSSVPEFGEVMRKTIVGLLDEFLAPERRILGHPERKKEFHAMRVEGKPLRYMLEIAAPLNGRDAKTCLAEIEAFLEKMGKVHDCDVAIDILTRFMQEIEAYDMKMERALAVIGTLLGEQETRRQRLFKILSGTMKRWKRDKFPERVAAALA